MRSTLGLVCLLGGLALPHSGNAQTLRDSLDDDLVAGRWKYNDWESAKAAAAKSKKPILALFR